MAAEEEKPLREVLSLPIILADRVIKSFHEAQSFKPENTDLADQVTHLAQLLHSANVLSTSSAVYDRPIRRVSTDVTKTLRRALILARKCRHKKINVLHHVLSITTTADFKKVANFIDNSIADMKWVISNFNHDSKREGFSIDLSLPPIASTDPILAWVWTYIAAVHSGRAVAAQELANLAWRDDRNKMIIVEENGVPPLLNMLRESADPDAQGAAAAALYNLADDHDCVMVIVAGLGVQVISTALNEAPMKVQVTLANLVSTMSERDVTVQTAFGEENVFRRLVTLLGMDVDLAEFKEANPKKTVHSLHSLVEMNNEMTKNNVRGSFMSSRDNYSSYKKLIKERETESPEVKMSLKVSCANALRNLAKESSSNCKKITETKALLVLAKIIEDEKNGELRTNCLMVVMELAAVAEINDDIKRASFKPTSTAAKVVFDQLVRVMNEETSPSMLTPAIRAIGCLSSMFSAKEKRIVQSLVLQLDHKNADVSTEAAKALGKFVCEDNQIRKEHSETVIEFGGVQKLMKGLVRGGDISLYVLLCILAINAGNSKMFERAGALKVLEGAKKNVCIQNPELRGLFAMAIDRLTFYQLGGAHAHRH